MVRLRGISIQSNSAEMQGNWLTKGDVQGFLFSLKGLFIGILRAERRYA